MIKEILYMEKVYSNLSEFYTDKILFVPLLIMLLIIIPITAFVLSNKPNTNPKPNAKVLAETTCQTPAQVTNVKVTYPSCQGDECSFVEADCSWDQSTDASQYNITVTEIDTNTVVKNETATNTTIMIVFPVTQNKTYKCEVAAVNSCGTAGPVGSDTVLCAVDAMVETPTPTVGPTRTATPTPTLIPTKKPKPTLTPPGSSNSTAVMGIGAATLIILGGALFLF